jgi:hypothetical protein
VTAVDSWLIARCENFDEEADAPCPGWLRFGWGQSDAPCSTCGSRCGIAVARWERVEGGASSVREEWAVWDPTHTSNPNDEAARARRVRDQAGAEDYIAGTVQRSRIARRVVTYGPWTAVAGGELAT